MPTVPVDSGIAHAKWVAGLGGVVGTGTFTATAAGDTTISDSSIGANAQIAVVATNGPAGLLLQDATCWVDGIAAGTFEFNVSATGAGKPAGTETFAYFYAQES